jgi:hypothetical protein
MPTWRLDFSSADGTRGRVELGIPGPDEAGRARYEARLAGSRLGPGVIVVRDHDVARPRGRLPSTGVHEIRADGLWAELVCETPGEHWSFGLEAFGLRVDSDEEADRSEVGERLPVGLDLEWEAPDLVHGELLVARDRIPFTGTGTFVELPDPAS